MIVLKSVFFNLWAMARGVPTLDGAQGRKQAWRPMFKTKIFRESVYPIKEVLAILLRLFSVLGDVHLLPPFVTPLVMTH